jgi:hypothetical protein
MGVYSILKKGMLPPCGAAEGSMRAACSRSRQRGCGTPPLLPAFLYLQLLLTALEHLTRHPRFRVPGSAP